jgi:ribonuclease BN (tRNA processing enzyme)
VLLRVEVEGTAVGYTGDTGPEPSIASFFRGVRLLIAECAVPDGSGVTNHLSPLEIAAIARDAAPSQLVLTHLYPTIPRESLAALLVALGVTVPILVADDGDRIEL